MATITHAACDGAQVSMTSIGDAVPVTDAGGHGTCLDRMAESMTGWSKGEALGQPSSRIFSIVDGLTGEAARRSEPGRIRHERGQHGWPGGRLHQAPTKWQRRWNRGLRGADT